MRLHPYAKTGSLMACNLLLSEVGELLYAKVNTSDYLSISCVARFIFSVVAQ